MFYMTPIIIPVSRGYHSISTGAEPLSAKIAVGSLIIAFMLLLGLMWGGKMVNEFDDSKLVQIIFSLAFLLLEFCFTCLLTAL